MYWKDLMPFDDPEERIEPGLFEHYRRMIAIRNTYPALQLGSYQTLLAKDPHRIFAFARTLDGESVVVVVNNSDARHRLDVPSPWADGTKVVRLTDSAACEVVDPPASEPAARPKTRVRADHQSPVKVEGGRLKGIMLEPRSTSAFAKN